MGPSWSVVRFCWSLNFEKSCVRNCINKKFSLIAGLWLRPQRSFDFRLLFVIEHDLEWSLFLRYFQMFQTFFIEKNLKRANVTACYNSVLFRLWSYFLFRRKRHSFILLSLDSSNNKVHVKMTKRKWQFMMVWMKWGDCLNENRTHAAQQWNEKPCVKGPQWPIEICKGGQPLRASPESLEVVAKVHQSTSVLITGLHGAA